ncbi:MAG: hypothetical protein AAF674_07070 [Pseudomonadota bacterium]
MSLSRESDTQRWSYLTQNLSSNYDERSGWMCTTVTIAGVMVVTGFMAYILSQSWIPYGLSLIAVLGLFFGGMRLVPHFCPSATLIPEPDAPAPDGVAVTRKRMSPQDAAAARGGMGTPAPATAAPRAPGSKISPEEAAAARGNAPAVAPAPAPGPAPAPAPEPMAETAPADVGTRPEALGAARDGQGDDLTLIKGVGPKLAELCNSLGFYHFDQIAAWSPDEVAWVDENLEGFKGRVSRDDWVAQAGILASGGQTEFSQRQQEE